MTVPFQVLFVVIFLPFVWVGVAAYHVTRSGESLDNKDHRGQQARQTGAAKRAYGAHYNALEAIPPFMAAVVTAHLFGADPARSANLCLAYLVFRVLHGVFYVLDWDKLRSIAFGLALVSVIGLFCLAQYAPRG
jgi:uncharacterized MAPEG superfamily protein